MNLGTRLGKGSEVVDHISFKFGHTNTSIADVKNLVLLVGRDTDVESWIKSVREV
jgi:hypothetical protein